jgi:hypothetical protein
MKYPRWFPTPSAWINSLELAIPTYLGTIVFSFYFWVFFCIFFIAGVATLRFSTLLLCLLSSVLLLLGLLWYLALKLLATIAIRSLWISPPKWLKPSWSWKEILRDYSISVLATLPTAAHFWIVCLIRANLNLSPIPVPNQNGKVFIPFIPSLDIAGLIVNDFWLWLIFAAYLIHLSSSRR